MILRYADGEKSVTSLDEALSVLAGKPQHFSVITESPKTGLRQVRYLTLKDDGRCVETYPSSKTKGA